MALTKNQLQFVVDAEIAGLKVNFSYSGRCMFGRTCPAVRVPNVYSFKTGAEVCTDIS
jgi:hypothetical protein